MKDLIKYALLAGFWGGLCGFAVGYIALIILGFLGFPI